MDIAPSFAEDKSSRDMASHIVYDVHGRYGTTSAREETLKFPFLQVLRL